MMPTTISPMASGNGAYVVHQCLSHHIRSYALVGYHPYLTFFPALLPIVAARYRPQLIHTSPDYAAFFVRRNVPMVLTFHNYMLDPYMRAYSPRLQRLHYATDLRILTRLGISFADRIVSVSRFTADIVCRDFGRTIPMDIIYNGVNTEMFAPSKDKPESKEVKVLFSGNLTRRKGAQWLLPIAEKLSHHIKIFYTQGLRSQGRLPPHARLVPIGPVDRNEMPARYREMDILLMPTVREGFSMAVLEAMACGLPVVASNCSSLPEQVEDGKGGFLCGVGDVEAFAEKINMLADSNSLRREMGAFNRAKVKQNFTLNRMIAQYQSLFDRVAPIECRT